MPGLVVIGGPTASGKSSLALALAQRLGDGGLGSMVLGADSRQVYREFDIGTAKPSPAQQQAVPHALIDLCDPTDTLTLAQYQRAAQAIIAQQHAQARLPLLVGGTGLYIDAVVRGLKIPPVAPQASLRAQLAALGQPHCHQLLTALDPTAAARIHPNDGVRTLRSLEVYYVTGQPISALQGSVPPPYPVLYLGLDLPPAVLHQRIHQRTHQMVADGFEAEVRGLVAKYGADLALLNTLGYAEMLTYLQGTGSLQKAIDAIITHTAQFAKQQRTWFRNRASVTWVDGTAADCVDQVWAHVCAWLDAMPAI